ncbi:MAG: type II toxin-antitoxin system HicB family antitoxin [Synergistaceae bacterium]|nr:type II toxin-antitoxin system HicB family antitoxin [Synergistaceae bacterium]
MRECYMIVERDEDGWYVGSVPSLPGRHAQGRTIDELSARMEEAISLYDDVPLAPVEFVGVQKVAVP